MVVVLLYIIINISCSIPRCNSSDGARRRQDERTPPHDEQEEEKREQHDAGEETHCRSTYTRRSNIHTVCGDCVRDEIEINENDGRRNEKKMRMIQNRNLCDSNSYCYWYVYVLVAREHPRSSQDTS
jgi:hypothetical protein